MEIRLMIQTCKRILLTIAQPFSNHTVWNVSRIDPDGNLYIGMGDGGSANDLNANAQNINVLIGEKAADYARCF